MLAEEKYLKELTQTQEAKILVVSDSHGRTENLRKAVEAKGKECQALIFAGDGIEDLFSLIEENYSTPQKFLPPVICFVRGNGDDSRVSYFTDEWHTAEIPESEVLTAAGKKLFITHGHSFNVYYTMHRLLDKINEEGYDAAIFGHTHVPFQERTENRLLLNPGSISLPRNHSDQCYVVLTAKKDESEIKYEFFSI